MKLNILERISLLNIIPREGNVLTLKIIRDLQGRLSFTEGEMKKYKMKQTTASDGRTSILWDEDFSLIEKDVEIGEAATDIIERELRKLDNQQRLRMEALSLYEKFVDGKETSKTKKR